MSLEQSKQLEELKEKVDNLNIQDKMTLVEHILSTTGIQVTVGGCQSFSAEVMFYIQNQSLENLQGIFDALASKFNKESKNSDSNPNSNSNS
ncbi:MAG: hypothetical protein ACFBSE_16830 [Prochloraceae cyanobacterium]